MVTDEDRDYMWAEYAKDPRMKANIGIRRRLAPLLDGDENRMELFTAPAAEPPGSPVLYYGDEIGMGDNIWLGDRDGVRTPDAVDARPQRRLLEGQPRQAAPAAGDGPRVRVSGGQRRG
jgi:maltose alpha-D-glucosyltransferase/alpha-amylase